MFEWQNELQKVTGVTCRNRYLKLLTSQDDDAYSHRERVVIRMLVWCDRFHGNLGPHIWIQMNGLGDIWNKRLCWWDNDQGFGDGTTFSSTKYQLWFFMRLIDSMRQNCIASSGRNKCWFEHCWFSLSSPLFAFLFTLTLLIICDGFKTKSSVGKWFLWTPFLLPPGASRMRSFPGAIKVDTFVGIWRTDDLADSRPSWFL